MFNPQIHTIELPDKIYKYYKINNYLIDNLKNSTLWFSKAADFNDPYDCYAELIHYEFRNEKQLKERAQQVVNSAFNTSRKVRRTEARYVIKHKAKFVEGYYATRQDTIDTQGICCFSLSSKNTLLWSHYANCHQGICLEFDHFTLKKTFDIHKVKYTEKFEPINYFDDPGKALKYLFTTKAKDWDYEQEYRAIKEGAGLSTFNKSCLTGIIFGCKVSESDVELVKTTIEKMGYNLSYFNAVMANKTFKLDIQPFNKI